MCLQSDWDCLNKLLIQGMSDDTGDYDALLKVLLIGDSGADFMPSSNYTWKVTKYCLKMAQQALERPASFFDT